MPTYRVGLLIRTSQVPAVHALRYGDVTLSLGPPWPEATAALGPVAHLAARLTEPTREAALLSARALLEEAVDSLSFLAQRVVHIAETLVVDVTPPLALGEDRPFMRFVDEHGESAISPKFLVPLSEAIVQPEMPAPHLIGDQPIGDKKVMRALWWYVKGMDTRYAPDKFIAFWTSLELLWEKEGPRVSEPYQVEKCKHFITNCPECDGPVEKVVRGSSFKQYLVTSFGVAPEVANKMWRIRQAVHGDDVFTAGHADEVGVLAAVLRVVVLAALKGHLGLAAEGPPIWEGGIEAGLHGQMVAGGTVEITQFDLDLDAVMDAAG